MYVYVDSPRALGPSGDVISLKDDTGEDDDFGKNDDNDDGATKRQSGAEELCGGATMCQNWDYD